MRPGPTVRSSGPLSLFLSRTPEHMRAYTAPPASLGLFVRPPFLLLGDASVRNVALGPPSPRQKEHLGAELPRLL